MKGSKEFFEELQEGQVYVNVFMLKEHYLGIDHELRELMVENEFRQHNDKFKDDEAHKKLRIKISNAKKELRNYEYDRNHKHQYNEGEDK